MNCKKQHRYLAEYSTLMDAQDNTNSGRHICAGCAYDYGKRISQ